VIDQPTLELIHLSATVHQGSHGPIGVSTLRVRLYRRLPTFLGCIPVSCRGQCRTGQPVHLGCQRTLFRPTANRVVSLNRPDLVADFSLKAGQLTLQRNGGLAIGRITQGVAISLERTCSVTGGSACAADALPAEGGQLGHRTEVGAVMLLGVLPGAQCHLSLSQEQMGGRPPDIFWRGSSQ